MLSIFRILPIFRQNGTSEVLAAPWTPFWGTVTQGGGDRGMNSSYIENKNTHTHIALYILDGMNRTYHCTD